MQYQELKPTQLPMKQYWNLVDFFLYVKPY